MPKTFCRSILLATGLFLLPLLASPSLARTAKPSPVTAPAAPVVHAGTIGEVLSAWQPKRHLYVIGDVGLGEDTLQEIAVWLGDRHWTVLLVQDAGGQTYCDVDGVMRQGEDAIEYGTGQGIPRRAGFSAQVHPRSQEPDGAILTIVIAQRALFYTGSQAQDSRALGEGQFHGNLDQWAIAAMRSGGDIVSAVKDTVTNIDSRLDAAVVQEIQAAEQTQANAAAQVARTNVMLAALEEHAAALRAAYPALSGAVANPDVEELRRQIAAAERSLPADPAATSRAVQEIQLQAGAQIQAIQAYPEMGKALDAVQARLASLERRGGAAASPAEMERSRRALAEARGLYGRGTPGYAEKLASAQSSLGDVETALLRVEAAAARQRLQDRFLLFLLAATLLAAGFVLNRRRRGVKREAEQLLAAWRAALDRKLEVLFDELESRAARFVGPASGEGKRPHAGETLRLAEQIRADLGSLSILWTSAGSVLERAEALIRAKGLAAVYNFFLPGRYRKGITLLKDEPVPFDPEGGLPRLFGAERTWRDDLLGDLASYQPFRKSFQEIVAELDLRAARAVEALDAVEWSMTQGPSILQETEERIWQTALRKEEIEGAADGTPGGLFRLPALFATVLPAADEALTRARTLFATDPVAALRGDGARARRIAVEAAQLAGLVTGARHGVLPAVERGAGALREAAILTRWIEEERSRLSGGADLLAARIAEAEVSLEIEDLALHLADLGLRVERAVALSRLLEGTARPEIRRVAEVVQAARGELGGALSLPAERILREDGADPSECLEGVDGAARQADVAQESLGRGGLEAAEAALAEAARLTREAEEIVAATRQAFAAQAATVEERRAETERIERLLPDHDRILTAIRETFAASVLILRADDPVHPGANGTLADNLEESRVHVGLAHEKLDRAVAVFPMGRLLAAARLLREVKEHQDFTLHRLREVTEREARLAKAVADNRDLLAALEGRVREDRVAVAGDPRTMRPTVAAFEDGERRVQEARRAVEAAPGDPLAAEDELLAAQAVLADVHDRMAPGDRLLFAEAQKSAAAADRQLAAAGKLARHAAADGIPDSPEINRGLGAVESLSSALAAVSAALSTPHGDWSALDVEADRILADSVRWAATLQGEIAAGEKAAAAISSASAAVREAGSWRGGYGVVVSGSPGSDTLATARTLLEEGWYGLAEQEAGSARREAANAVAEAEATVRRYRAAEERREEERREESRRRAASATAARSFVSSSSGSSSGSGSSSSRSSGSGSGSSSYGSSSSGSGKSGW